MDPNKAYEIGRQGDEQRFRSLIQDALSEGNEAVASWLINKVKDAHEGSFKDIIEEAVTNANTETEAYKPTDLAKKYWNEYFPEAEQQDSDYPDPSDVGGLIYNSTAKKRNALMRDWLEHNFRNDGFSLPKSLFNRIHDSVNNLTGVNKDPEDEAAFINALNKEFKNDFVSDDDEEHFGEEQAEGLDNLLAGLKDGPKDERW